VLSIGRFRTLPSLKRRGNKGGVNNDSDQILTYKIWVRFLTTPDPSLKRRGVDIADFIDLVIFRLRESSPIALRESAV